METRFLGWRRDEERRGDDDCHKRRRHDDDCHKRHRRCD